MEEPYLGEIMMFGGDYAPPGWMVCDGTELEIAKNEALFSILKTTYGGDGTTTFALPDLRGRAPASASEWLYPQFTLGAQLGEESVALGLAELPYHDHTVQCSGEIATEPSPAGNFFASEGSYIGSTSTSMSYEMVQSTGGGLPHTNMQPSLVITFLIAVEGVFPPTPPGDSSPETPTGKEQSK